MGLPRMLRRGLGQSPYRNAAVALSLTLVVMWATDAMRAGRTPSSVPLLFSSPGAGACQLNGVLNDIL